METINNNKINKVESADDTITGKGGMPLFSEAGKTLQRR